MAGCGGGETRREAPPRLPAPLAGRLATQADEIAVRLDTGDACGAAELGRALHQEAIAAVNRRGTVPAQLKEPFLSGVADLAGRLEEACASAAPPPPPTTTAEEEDHEDDGQGKKEGHGKRKHGRKGKDH